MLRGLETLSATGHEFLNDEEAEDVHHFVEKNLQRIIGETALKLHAGRSRNEQIATDLRLFVRAVVRPDLRPAGGAGAGDCRARQRRGHGGHAVLHPSAARRTGAGGALAAGLLRDVSARHRTAGRLPQAAQLLPAGLRRNCRGDAGAGPRTGRRASWSSTAPTANSMDATSDRDFALEFAQVLSILAVHLSRWAEEFILFSTLEYGFVRSAGELLDGIERHAAEAEPG